MSKSSTGEEAIAAPNENKDKKSKPKAKTKFIGGYFEAEIVEVLQNDADAENRTASKHMEFLVLLGLKARGVDISQFTSIGVKSLDFQLMDEFMAWKIDQDK